MKRLIPILMALGLAAMAMVPLLTGCSGDDPIAPDPDPEPESVPTERVDGTVALPGGWTGTLSDLRVVDILESKSCGADGAFSLLTHEDHTQMTFVFGPDDGLVLLGWFGAGTTELSLRSTAEVMAWLGVGAWMTAGDTPYEIRDLLADPALDLSSLEAAWAAMLEDNPDGVVEEDQALFAALEAVVADLLELEKGVIIEPGAQLSGVEVLNQGGINKVTIKNSYRRRAAGFLWRLGYRDTNNVDQWLDPPELLQEFEVPPVDGFDGTLNTIVGAVMGGLAYEPVEMEPVLLEWLDDAKRDFYRFNLLGMGLEEPDDPSLYTAYEIEQGEWMAMKCMLLDYFLPMFMNVVDVAGVTAAQLFDNGIPSQVNDFVLLVSTELPDFYNQTMDGQFWTALHTLWDATLNTGTMRNWILDLVSDALQAGRFTAAEAGAVLHGVNRAFLCLKIVDIIGNFADNMITGYHFGLCKKAESWDLTVTTPVIHIEPREAEMMVYDTKLLTLVVDDDTGGYPSGWAYAYHWSCPGAYGTLVNPMDVADTGNDFVTSSDWVHYIADGGDQGDETITCELYVTLGGDQTYIRDSVCELEVKKQHIVLSDTLQTCPYGTLEIVPYLDPPWEGDGTLYWNWSGGGTNGTLHDLYYNHYDAWVSTDPIAVFNVDSDGGDDWVTCIAEAHLTDGTVAGIDTVEVFIEDVSAFEPYQGEHYCYTNFVNNNGSCTEGFRIVVSFEEIPGVLRYRIHGTGFNDPWYYGTEYDTTIRARYLERRNGMFIVGLTSGGGSADCNNPTPDEELCSQMWRFEGATWEITPVCP